MIDARVKVNSAGCTVLDGPRRVLCAVGSIPGQSAQVRRFCSCADLPD